MEVVLMMDKELIEALKARAEQRVERSKRNGYFTDGDAFAAAAFLLALEMRDVLAEAAAKNRRKGKGAEDAVQGS